MKNKWANLLVGLTWVCMIGFSLSAANAQSPAKKTEIMLEIPVGAKAGQAFDVNKATDAYINLLSEEDRARSDAYMEGGYWLQLWGFYMVWAWPGCCSEPGFLPGCVIFQNDLAAGDGCTRSSTARSMS